MLENNGDNIVPPSDETKYHRVVLDFSEPAFQALDWMSKATGQSPVDEIRDALGLRKFVLEALLEGEKVYFVAKDGKVKQLNLPALPKIDPG